jgi:nitrous oxide reductase accessory protein NosL
MAKKASIYACTALVVLGALFAGGYGLVHRRTESVCGFCSRHVMPQARVVAEVGGRTTVACCVHCALTEARQEHKPLRLIEVTDYRTGAKLKPEQAWYVEGSRIVSCEHNLAKIDETKHAEQMAFDRCSPGTFAFRDRQAAAAFAAENGGVVRDLAELLGEVQPQ